MNTNKLMFGPVVLEIACDLFYEQDISFPLKHVGSVKRIEVGQSGRGNIY